MSSSEWDHTHGKQAPDEEYESIPWDALVRSSGPDWRRIANLVALMVSVAAVSTLVVRTMWPAGTSTPEPTPDAVARPETVEPIDQAPPPTVAPAPPAEADLRALDPSSNERTVAAYAEWYAAEFFTIDASSRWIDPVTGSDPAAAVPSEALRYVESVTAIEVAQVALDRHDVTVVIRSLSAAGISSGYRRDPPLAVVVSVVLTPEGLRVEDFPRPATVPVLTLQSRGPLEPAFDPVATDAVLAMVRDLGLEPSEPFSVTREPDGATRVALLVVDAVGVRWPIAVVVDPDGTIRE